MKTISLRLPQELLDYLKKYAESEDRSLNKFIVRTLMTEHLERDKELLPNITYKSRAVDYEYIMPEETA